MRALPWELFWQIVVFMLLTWAIVGTWIVQWKRKYPL